MPAKKKPAARPQLKILYVGNFDPPHSTENHVLRALRHNGHTVTPVQESHEPNWHFLADDTTWEDRFGFRPDLILWTRTGWTWANPRRVMMDQIKMQQRARANEVPVVGYHLDIWWGLKREFEIDEEPFFSSDLVVTADGGHEERWLDHHVNHHWMPPGVSIAECELGTRRDEFVSPLAFVGSWQGHYHHEHQHRHDLIAFLRKNFRSTCRFYPEIGQPAVRGEALRDLYASTDVAIGDSCFAGTGLARYWSDRIPETLGRGGYLIHPHVPGIDAFFIGRGRDNPHMAMWDAGDWDSLGEEIGWALTNPAERREIAMNGRENVLAHHTYERRMEQLVTLLQERNML